MKIIHILCLLPLFFFHMVVFAQQGEEVRIAGTVLDEFGEALPGVSVYIKDRPTAGTSTDVEGKFSITVAYGDRLVFTFVGYDPIEHVSVRSTDNLVMQFSEMGVGLEEFVVVGLGATERKISSVGAISSVDVGDLQVPARSVANLLGGRAAGIISLQNSGEPGQNIS
ncbi:MAG: carboxypeptidase-like regulatory domain-containing protein, partial [Anaerolineaceae bacterium]|nr:carboxypeptidase-like regulatory domain-containing protein [Anaerolineaceae bacterium]